MELFDRELEEVRKYLSENGGDPDAFRFERTFLPPESEDGAMFTVRYEVTASRRMGGPVLTSVGGIGLDWVRRFKEALGDGYFDRP
jgi:hypothetical protein